jgi:hypothetical protein
VQIRPVCCCPASDPKRPATATKQHSLLVTVPVICQRTVLDLASYEASSSLPCCLNEARFVFLPSSLLVSLIATLGRPWTSRCCCPADFYWAWQLSSKQWHALVLARYMPQSYTSKSLGPAVPGQLEQLAPSSIEDAMQVQPSACGSSIANMGLPTS